MENSISTKEVWNVVHKKEFYPISSDEPTIGLLMMVKNEKKRIQVTLDSVKGYVDCLIIYDTGSTDNTREIIADFCETNKINLYMIQGEFVNFCTSRNVSLDYADTIPVKYILLMDCNDELRGGEKLKIFAKFQMTEPSTGYLVCQHWWSGQYDTYFNMRFVKARGGWRYKGVVHEWMKDTTSPTDNPSFPVIKIDESIVLYQDRTQDDDKTGKRFRRDVDLLYAEYKKDPKEPRTLFYLAQTYACLQMNDDAFYFNKLRTLEDGFQEEKFHSFLRCGDLSVRLGHSWFDTILWYIRSIDHTPRAEPLNRIAAYYISKQNWFLAHSFLYISCNLEFPHTAILFVDKRSYDYDRWHLMGVVGKYVQKYEDGKKGCMKAIDAGINVEVDKKNLQEYLEIEKKALAKLPKKIFFEKISAEIREKYPLVNDKKIETLTILQWKSLEKYRKPKEN